MAETAVSKIALVGGGPCSLYLLKKLVEAPRKPLEVHIFERKPRLGRGMPYSQEGAGPEHLTNISPSELPQLVTPLDDWVRALSEESRQEFGLDLKRWDDDKVLPRLLFGVYLESQFEELIRQGEEREIAVTVHTHTRVEDLRDSPKDQKVAVLFNDEWALFDTVVICIGHRWPNKEEDPTRGFFTSPYPPRKLEGTFDHPVAIRGTSLTALDAVRTLSRQHGTFQRDDRGRLHYRLNPHNPAFKLVLHSRSGLLPCVRVHFEEPQVVESELLSKSEWVEEKRKQEGFVPVDLLFEKSFLEPLADSDPALYEQIKGMSLEEFVEAALQRRKDSDPLSFFKREYKQALASENNQRPVPWKEALSALSFALNYPAKHFSAEDYLRMRNYLQPLISIVIAFIPTEAAEEIIALHESGRLEVVKVGEKSRVERRDVGIEYHYSDSAGEAKRVEFQTYVDGVGQPALGLEDLPFPSLKDQNIFSPARLRFKDDPKQQDRDENVEQEDGAWFLTVPGIAINDSFQPINEDGDVHPRLYMLAVPYIGGYNPDYSGLDLCNKISEIVVDSMMGVSREPELTPRS